MTCRGRAEDVCLERDGEVDVAAAAHPPSLIEIGYSASAFSPLARDGMDHDVRVLFRRRCLLSSKNRREQSRKRVR